MDKKPILRDTPFQELAIILAARTEIAMVEFEGNFGLIYTHIYIYKFALFYFKVLVIHDGLTNATTLDTADLHIHSGSCSCSMYDTSTIRRR